MKSYEIVLRPEVKVRGWCKDGVCCIEATIPTAYGDLKLAGSYPLAKAAKELHARLAARGVKVQGAETGGFFSKLKKLARKVAQARALAPIIQSVKQIQKNPLLARAVGLTTAVIPGLGSAKFAVEKAASLVQSAAKGNPKALSDLLRLKSLAKMGIPEARDAWRLAQLAHRKIGLRKPVDFFRGMAAPAVQAVQQAAALAPLATPFFPAAALVPQFTRMAAPMFSGAVDDATWLGC